MRLQLLSAAGALILSLSLIACGGEPPTPTPTPAPTAQMPATAAPTEAATLSPATATAAPSVTATQLPPTATPTTAPTATAVAPAATALRPTTTATDPTILAFTVSPEQVRRGEPVTLTWETANAPVVVLHHLDSAGQLAAAETIVSPAGSLVVETAGLDDVEGLAYVFALIASSGEPAWVYTSAAARADILCETTWFFPDPPPDCPAEQVAEQVAAQRFERGLMLWVGRADGGGAVYVLDEAGDARAWREFDDQWVEGMAESDPAIVAPADRYQPVRGFGLVWRNNAEVRERLGWAVEQESLIEGGKMQCDRRSAATCYISGPGGAVYALAPAGSGWEVWP